MNRKFYGQNLKELSATNLPRPTHLTITDDLLDALMVKKKHSLILLNNIVQYR